MKRFYKIFFCLVLICCFTAIIFMQINKNKTNNSCATIGLNIETYLEGQNQCTHPNVIAFNQPWHGYRYWMAYTPYPYANESEENPSIAAANNMLEWQTPYGLANPVANNNETGCAAYKDTHLLYREDSDLLELWYLGRVSANLGGDDSSLTLFRKVSEDGVNWGNYEIMHTFSMAPNLFSHTVYWNGSEYQYWGIVNDPYTNFIGFYYMSSPDGFSWSNLQRCEVENLAETDIWHGAVTVHEGQYIFVWVGLSGKPQQRIYYATSSDGLNFSGTKIIVENNAGWVSLYRPALTIVDNNYYLFYGTIGFGKRHFISMSYGPQLDNLTGITPQQLTGENYNKALKPFVLSEAIFFIRRLLAPFLRLELAILLPILYGCYLLLKRFTPLAEKKIIYILWLFASIAAICYLYIAVGFRSMVFTFLCIFAGLSLGLSLISVMVFFIYLFKQSNKNPVP